MAKQLSAKVGEFTNQQNEQKGEYIKLGVLMPGQSGEFLLLDPTVSLAGVLAKQNALAISSGKPVRDSVMVSVFDDSQQNQGGYQQQGQSQGQQQGGYQQQDNNNQQQGGYQQQPSNQQNQGYQKR